MGMNLAVIKIAANTPVEKDKLQIVARWWNSVRCTRFIGIKRWYYFVSFFFICRKYYGGIIGY